MQVRRDFPWRGSTDPYAVWVSEVMLQQTRASVVVPYFTRWMRVFPDVVTLARAQEQEVLKCFEGLGYYRRAKQLHRGAQKLMEMGYTTLPSDREVLESIPGLGPYTIGAILSFAFHQRVPAVDGNVERVLSRVLAYGEVVTTARARRFFHEAVLEILPDEDAHVTMEALIELGATVCGKVPDCGRCPIQPHCLGQESPQSFPKKGVRAPTVHLHRAVFVCVRGDCVWVLRGKEGAVMGDLQQFPYVETRGRGVDVLLESLEKEFGIVGGVERVLRPVCHTFTKYKAHLTPYVIRVEDVKTREGEWLDREGLSQRSFCSGHRQILEEFVSCTLFI